MIQMNQSALIQVLKDFYTLTKIRIVLWDSDFREILCYPKEHIPFCSQIRRDSGNDAKCVASDRAGCRKSVKTNGLVIYHCHAGLTEVVMPIQDRYGTMGYIFFGQTLLEDTHHSVKQKLYQNFPEEQFPGINEAIEAIGVKTEAELNAAATVLQALTSYILTNQWVMPKQADFIRQLDQYIAEHIDQSITVEQLCKDFRIGRTRFYSLTSDFLECSIAKYIRKKRIEEAQRLLCETEMSIVEIAEATGFSNYNHFFCVFKEESKMSARRYRQRYLENKG